MMDEKSFLKRRGLFIFPWTYVELHPVKFYMDIMSHMLVVRAETKDFGRNIHCEALSGLFDEVTDENDYNEYVIEAEMLPDKTVKFTIEKI